MAFPRFAPLRLVAAFVLAVCGLGAANDQSGRPIIRAFGSAEIHAKGPVLSFAETSDGCLFLGSNHLVIFDGLRWRPIDIPGAYRFKGLAASPDDNRVWVGGAGAVGYALRDPFGGWKYVSLLPALEEASIPIPAQIESAAALGPGAAFLSNRSLLRWDGTRFESWDVSDREAPQAASDESGALWVWEEGNGLLRLAQSGPPRLIRPIEGLPPGVCTWLVAPPRGADLRSPAGALIGTSNGAFRLTLAGFERLPMLSATLNGLHANQASATGAHQISIGTPQGGLVIARRDGAVVASVDHASGLPEDSIFGVWSDRRGGIWAGFDGGCARIDRVGSASVFTAREGLQEGLPRKTLAIGDTIYVLTDKVLSRLVPGPAPAHFVSVFRQQSRLTDMVTDGSALWVSGSAGIWRVNGSSVIPVWSTREPVGHLALAPWLSDGVLFTEGFALKCLLPLPGGGWKPYDFGVGLPTDPVSLLADRRGNVWVSTVSDGIHRYRLMDGTTPAEPQLSETAWYREDHGLPASVPRPVLSMLGSLVVAFSEGQVIAFAGDSFRSLPRFSGWTIQGAATVARTGDFQGSYWLAQRSGLSDSPPYDLLHVRPPAADSLADWVPTRAAGLDEVGDATSIDITSTTRGVVAWIGGGGGLLRLNLGGLEALSANRDLELREARVNDQTALPLRPAKAVLIAPHSRSVDFGFSAAQPMESEPAVFYQTRLAGVETEWSAPDRKATCEFVGLAPGRYTFMVRRIDRYGRIGTPFSYPFIMVAPWYWRWPAWLAYTAAAGGLGLLIFRWRVRALHAQTERLNRVVALRTRELELSSTAKSEFLESISHEIRNPLNGIVGLAGMLDPSRLPEEDREVVQSLKVSAERLRRVSEDILSQSNIEFGTVSIADRPFTVTALLDRVRDDHLESARKAGCSLTLETVKRNEPGSDRLVGDDAKIRTIVGNFVANAIKYAPGTPIVIRGDWTEEENGAAQLFVAVTDGGPGVPLEEQELIFQRFVRGSHAREAGVPGSGVGLAICRALARRMGGTVGVESPVGPAAAGHPGAGATFHVWLPVRGSGPLDNPAALASIATAAAEGTPQLALIVDDEGFNRLVLAGLARELGFKPEVAPDAESGLQLARREMPAIAFLDLELPGMKGPETAARLREFPGGRECVIVAVTGHDSADMQQRCREAGMDGFMVKPFDADQLRSTLARIQSDRTAPRRAFTLYAQGAGRTEAEAQARFVGALEQELAAIRRAETRGDREALRGAGHRLRSLAALVAARELNAAAARLQDLALTLPSKDLAALIDEVMVRADQLRSDLAAGATA